MDFPNFVSQEVTIPSRIGRAVRSVPSPMEIKETIKRYIFSDCFWISVITTSSCGVTVVELITFGFSATGFSAFTGGDLVSEVVVSLEDPQLPANKISASDG